MKKFFLLLFLGLLVCFLFIPKEEIRIRVISNSNSEKDILYKEEVVKYLKEEILIDKDLNDIFFEENYQQIEKELNKKFENIVVKYEPHTFVNKTYNGSALENETYQTLLIVIGDGNGDNWWGSIFEGSLNKESDEAITYEWYFKKFI